MMNTEVASYDVTVTGTGIGGLYTALSLSEKLKVLLISKGRAKNCNTIRAEGGMAAAVGMGDSPILHAEDTIAAGGGLNDTQVVKIFTNEVIDRIYELEKMGFKFDKDENSNYILGLEGFHSTRRILHQSGDKIGKGIFAFLYKNVKTRKNISILENANLTDILLNGNDDYEGIQLLKDNEPYFITSKYLILAGGGYAGIFKKSTNDPFVTGDQLAVSYRIGVLVEDLEFVQFHPTVFFKDGFDPFLISEAVRGEGAILLNSEGKQFMKKYHSKGELASRDIVSKAIYEEMRRQKSQKIYLDMSLLGKKKIEKLFPNIYKNCELREINVTKDKIPIHPAAHYSMGGIKTNLCGETNINGVFAVGEISCNGLHGANRLASNSLPEALVFGKRISQEINFSTFSKKEAAINNRSYIKRETKLKFPDVEELREKNWNYLGIERNREELTEYRNFLEPLFVEAINLKPKNSKEASTYNIIILSYLLLFSALIREESRGSHFRIDFPSKRECFKKSIDLKRVGELREFLPKISYTERR